MRKHHYGNLISVAEAHNGLYPSEFWYSYWLPLLTYCDFPILGVDPNLVCKMYSYPKKHWTVCFLHLTRYIFQKSIIFDSNKKFTRSYFFEH